MTAATKRSRAKPGDPRGGGDRKQRAAEIMDAALHLFAENGVSRVTIKDIGRACDLNAAMIYYYFENKEDLFRASIEHAITQLMERYRDLRVAHDDPRDLINDWLEVNLQLEGPLTNLAKIMSDYAFAETRFPSVDRLIDQLYEQECTILEENIAECVKRGIFKGVDAKSLARFVSIHLDGVFFASVIRSNTDLAEMINALKQLLWNQIAEPAKRQGG